jgi:hypothetical protein
MKLPAVSSLAILAIVLALTGCGNNQSGSAPSQTNTAAAPPAPSGNYLDTLANSRDHAVGVVDLASINQAIQVFNANEGRYPADLEELVTNKLIGEIPPTPRGKKLDYNPATGEIKLIDQ